METVNNIASAASRAIWGGSTETTGNETAGTEPASGQTGNVEAGEPYDKGNEPVNTTTSSSSTGLPTYLNYQKGETSTPTGTITDSTIKDTPSTSTDTTSTQAVNTANTSAPSDNTASTSTPSAITANTSTPSDSTAFDSTPSQKTPTPSNPTTSTTSKMADNTPSTTIDKPATSGSDTAAPSSRADPHPAATAVGNQEAIKKNVPDKSDNNDEASQQAALEADGITETKGEGDHAPKFDTFKTKEGPHIGDGKNDGRVGPSYEKGDLKEYEDEDAGEGAKGGLDTGKDVDRLSGEKESQHGSGSDFKKETSAADSGHSVDSADKEKVSLKDKIKAKLHKH